MGISTDLSSAPSGRLLGMFAKFWEPGKVKTRLAAKVGNADAAEIYRTFVLSLASQLAHVNCQRRICFWPREAGPQFQETFGGEWETTCQAMGDLGDRMRHFFTDAFLDSNLQQAVLIGTDSPWISPQTIQMAFDLLSEHEVVLGPSEDGGYYLIGMRRPCPNLFLNIRWSTEHVMDQTLAILDRDNVSYALMSQGMDIDDFDDLTRFLDSLHQKRIGGTISSSEQMLLKRIEAEL